MNHVLKTNFNELWPANKSECKHQIWSLNLIMCVCVYCTDRKSRAYTIAKYGFRLKWKKLFLRINANFSIEEEEKQNCEHWSSVISFAHYLNLINALASTRTHSDFLINVITTLDEFFFFYKFSFMQLSDHVNPKLNLWPSK